MKLSDRVVDVMILDSNEALRISGASGENSIIFAPFGPWRLMEINAISALPSIEKSKYERARPEPYILVVTHTRCDTVAFEYVITGRTSAGKRHTITGAFDRNDVPPLAPASSVIVRTGRLTEVSIRITELARRPFFSEPPDTPEEPAWSETPGSPQLDPALPQEHPIHFHSTQALQKPATQRG